EAHGNPVRLNAEVIQMQRREHRMTSVTVRCGEREEVISGTHFISSMPLRLALTHMTPPPPDHILDAARKLRHRDFLMVVLVVNQQELFPDNWIYIHDPEVKVARIQNFKNWSTWMVPDAQKTSLGLEYFCNEGDALWTMSDSSLIGMGARELEYLGLAK